MVRMCLTLTNRRIERVYPICENRLLRLWLSKKGCYERPDMFTGHMTSANAETKPNLVANG